MSENETVMVEVIRSAVGDCLSINDTRVAGEKPLGGGIVIQKFFVKVKDILEIIAPKESENK